MNTKKTLVIGASNNPRRYSHKAILLLQEKGIENIGLGLRAGNIQGTEIETEWKQFEDIDTVTLYIGPKNQDKRLEQYLLALKPKRVIFNPGTENYKLMKLLQDNDIEVEAACTLVLLQIGQY